MSRLRRIAQRFGDAAPTYEGAARVQAQVAEALALAIAGQDLPKGGRVLELGCGAGALTRALLALLEPSLWIASDIAPGMLARARQSLGHPAVAFACVDGAQPALAGGFDLVCSSLTLQWLDDPTDAIDRWRRLARPGGLLAFSTLLDGTFGEWRQAVRAAGAPEPGPALPTLETLRSWLGAQAIITPLDLIERHADGLSFLKAARLTGVDTSFGRALGPGTMRRAMKAFEAAGAAITYRAALVLLRA
jgi:malonyl-CoA O-methyltransferase